MNIYIVYDSMNLEIDGVYTNLELAMAGTGAPDDCNYEGEWEERGNQWICRYVPDDWDNNFSYGHEMVIVQERLIGDIDELQQWRRGVGAFMEWGFHEFPDMPQVGKDIYAKFLKCCPLAIIDWNAKLTPEDIEIMDKIAEEYDLK